MPALPVRVPAGSPSSPHRPPASRARRRFLLAACGLALTPALARCVAARRAPAFLQHVAPRDPSRLRLACIGTANRAWENIQEVRHEQVVALCDVDSEYLARAAREFPGAARTRDWREVVAHARDLDLDGIVVSTPDHMHAPIATAALSAGIPVYCEKPLTRTVAEARALRALAASAGVPTQMGTQIHAGENYRRVVEAVRAGAIGRVTAVDCWVSKSWGDGRLTPGARPPATLDWDLWQGDVPRQAYIEGIHPGNWRRYWAYGTGTLGDMGCHVMDLPAWALGLTDAHVASAEVFAEGPSIDAVGTPAWLEASWAIPDPPAVGGAASGSPDPLVLRWFDGGRVSPFVQEIGAKDRVDYHGRFNVCFQGTQGALFANYGEMLLWPGALAQSWRAPAPSFAPSPGHHREWLLAIRERRADAPLCNFAYASRLTELVLRGLEAYRAGGRAPGERGAQARTIDGA
jgi:predicted dehydrogenase